MTTLNDRNTQEVIMLLSEIDSEIRGRSRVRRIINLTRRIRLIINKSRYDRYRKCGSSEHYGCSV